MELRIDAKMNEVRWETSEALKNLRKDVLEVQKSQEKMREVLNRMTQVIHELAAQQAQSEKEEEADAVQDNTRHPSLLTIVDKGVECPLGSFWAQLRTKQRLRWPM